MDEEGVIEYSVNDGSYPDMKLHTRIIDIDGEKDFHWRGTTADKQNSLTLICRDYGVCGSIYLGETNTRIHIVPLTDTESVLILDTQTGGSCETESDNPSSDNGECDGDCPEHIDILFVLEEVTHDALGNNARPHLDRMIGDLLEVWQNSNTMTLNSTFSFDITIANFPIIENDCRTSAIEISERIDAQNLRNLYNADVVVYIPRENKLGNLTGCTAAIGPISDLAYMVIPLDESLNEYTFPHEFGHILGGEHFDDRNIPPTCGRGFRLEFETTDYFTAITATPYGFERIPHYSNPEVTWKFVPTGQIDQNDDNFSNNNAGKLNTNSCIVGDFRTNLNTINSNIIVTEQNCQLHLEALVELPNSNYVYEWQWSQDGLFNSYSPGISLGTGNNLIVDEPVSDNCGFYFINVNILENNIVISTSIINIQSGIICVDNVQPCSGPSNSIGQHINPNAQSIQPKINYPSTSANEISEFRLYSINGQLLVTFTSYPSNYLLSDFVQNTGVFILQELKEGQIIRTQKVTIHED